jgi:hypothetical protein
MPTTGTGLGSGSLVQPLTAAANPAAIVTRDLPAIDGLPPAVTMRRAVECPVCRVLVPLAGIDGHAHFQVVDL